MFYRNSAFHRHVNTLHWDLRLVRALAESGCISLMFRPQQLCHPLRIGCPHCLKQRPTPRLRGAAVGENSSKFGAPKMRPKTMPTGRLHLTCGQPRQLLACKVDMLTSPVAAARAAVATGAWVQSKHMYLIRKSVGA